MCKSSENFMTCTSCSYRPGKLIGYLLWLLKVQKLEAVTHGIEEENNFFFKALTEFGGVFVS